MKTYTFSEYKKIQEMNHLEKMVYVHEKELVFFFTIAPLVYPNVIHAESLDSELSIVANEIIRMILVFGRYGCLGMGIKSMIENMLQGANIKEATSEGLQYFLFYIVLKLYPKLFSMLKF